MPAAAWRASRQRPARELTQPPCVDQLESVSETKTRMDEVGDSRQTASVQAGRPPRHRQGIQCAERRREGQSCARPSQPGTCLIMSRRGRMDSSLHTLVEPAIIATSAAACPARFLIVVLAPRRRSIIAVLAWSQVAHTCRGVLPARKAIDKGDKGDKAGTHQSC